MAESEISRLPLVAEAEFALVGRVMPGERRPEGPFGDHYGYYSLVHDYPVFRVEALARREHPLFPATVVGKPRQEDFFIGDYLQELLSPLFPVVMPAVRDLWSYGETGFHSLTAAVVRQRYKREAMASAFRILGEGQLSLTKFLLVLDRPCDLRDFRSVLEEVLRRADFHTDLYVLGNLAMDSLDYAGPRIDEGSKGVLLGVGDPIRELPASFTGPPPPGVTEVRVFCPGCLVLQGPPFPREISRGRGAGDIAPILAHPALADWPLVVITDDAARTTKSVFNFLWTTFTRFEPAADRGHRRPDEALVPRGAVLRSGDGGEGGPALEGVFSGGGRRDGRFRSRPPGLIPVRWGGDPSDQGLPSPRAPAPAGWRKKELSFTATRAQRNRTRPSTRPRTRNMA